MMASHQCTCPLEPITPSSLLLRARQLLKDSNGGWERWVEVQWDILPVYCSLQRGVLP